MATKTKKKSKATNIIVRYGYAYKRVGSYKSKPEAIRYKRQELHSIMVVSDEPRVYGVGVRYHVYRRIT